MFKAIDKWLPGYVRSVLSRPRQHGGPRHLFFCVTDHFEPRRGGIPVEQAREFVRSWVTDYTESVRAFRDADGRLPQHTFFYPAEEYDPAVLDSLAGLCRKGLGEVEIHLHHRHDTAEGVRHTLEAFRDTLRKEHGLLGSDVLRREDAGGPGGGGGGCVRYGFIHGNWALCNSRPDGDWCGVNEELGILAATGCYADFTFPSAPSPTQARMVNAIYRACDIPGRPRSADSGVRVVVTGQKQAGRGLMLIQGPLALNWRRRKWGVLPRIENAELSGANPPTADRLRLWIAQQIGVGGMPDWVFVKVHTHGCVPPNRDVLLGSTMRDLHLTMQRDFNDGKLWQTHYVTAREIYNLVRAAEDGVSGEPGAWRDYMIGRPPCC